MTQNTCIEAFRIRMHAHCSCVSLRLARACACVYINKLNGPVADSLPLNKQTRVTARIL